MVSETSINCIFLFVDDNNLLLFKVILSKNTFSKNTSLAYFVDDVNTDEALLYTVLIILYEEFEIVILAFVLSGFNIDTLVKYKNVKFVVIAEFDEDELYTGELDIPITPELNVIGPNNKLFEKLICDDEQLAEFDIKHGILQLYIFIIALQS
jgi:hypothetical protein